MNRYALAAVAAQAAEASTGSAANITAYGSMIVGILTAAGALVLAFRKKVADEDVPALKDRVEKQSTRIKQLEDGRDTDRAEYEAELRRTREAYEAELRQTREEFRREFLAIDAHMFKLERVIASDGKEVPPRPATLRAVKDVP